MYKFFDSHLHYSLENSLKDTVKLFKKEFEMVNMSKMAFLSLPHDNHQGTMSFDHLQNIKGLYLKYKFSPNAYAYAGLEHSQTEMDVNEKSKLYLSQVEEYFSNGYDGLKMLEGYPFLRKFMDIPLNDNVYERFYSFMEENQIPITMHIANPVENWDISKVDVYALKMGRYCDSSYPTKQQLHDEVNSIMDKHPKLKLTLAHFGFLTYDINQAKKFLDDYPNTMLDTTPGGEQYFNMLEKWDEWHRFFEDYQDRIVYGTDFYAIPPVVSDEEWTEAVYSRTNFVKNFFTTNTEHVYAKQKYKGINLESNILRKIFYDNAQKLLGEPKKINQTYMIEKANKLLVSEKDESLRQDILEILNNVK